MKLLFLFCTIFSLFLKKSIQNIVVLSTSIAFQYTPHCVFSCTNQIEKYKTQLSFHTSLLPKNTCYKLKICVRYFFVFLVLKKNFI